jgi:hypothetical protein
MTTRLRFTSFLGLLSLISLLACGVDQQIGGTGGDGPGGKDTTTTASDTTSTTTTSTTTTASVDCQAASDAIAANMGVTETCTATVRLDYQSLAILGFAVRCGPYNVVDEATARATAVGDTGQGESAGLLGTPPPEDEWVFYQAPSDWGSTAVVSARSGLSVFGGTTVWIGDGEISYPQTWQPPTAIGAGCGQTGIQVPPARGFELAGGTELPASSVNAALAAVWSTAIPSGLLKGGYLFDAIVLLYPRTVGAFDPTTAEWIVLVNSGWLE